MSVVRGELATAGARTSRELSIQSDRLWMYSVKGFDVIGNQVEQFGHDGFNTGRIASCVGGVEQDAVQPLVVRTDAQSLARRPFCSGGIEGRQAVLRISTCEIHDARFHCRQNSL